MCGSGLVRAAGKLVARQERDPAIVARLIRWALLHVLQPKKYSTTRPVRDTHFGSKSGYGRYRDDAQPLSTGGLVRWLAAGGWQRGFCVFFVSGRRKILRRCFCSKPYETWVGSHMQQQYACSCCGRALLPQPATSHVRAPLCSVPPAVGEGCKRARTLRATLLYTNRVAERDNVVHHVSRASLR